MKSPDLANGRVGTVLLRLALPPMAGMLIFSLLSLVEVFFVAQIGGRELAALTMAAPAQILITSLAASTGVGLTSLLGRSLGGGHNAKADNAAWHGLFLGLFYSAVIMAGGWYYLDSVLAILGCQADIFAFSREYLRIVLLGCGFTFTLMLLGDILQGEGNTVLPMVISLSRIFLNVLFDPLFIFGWGPVPAWGLKGVALAGLLADFIVCLGLVYIIRRKELAVSWEIKQFHPNLAIIKEIYQVGFPFLIMELANVLLMAWFNRTIASYGFSVVAALGLFMRIKFFFQTPIFGLLQGVMPLAAFAYGAGRIDRIKETLFKASSLSIMLLTVACIVIQCYPATILNFFSPEPDLINQGIAALRLATIFMPLIGPALIVHTVLQALGRGTSAMVFSLLRQIGIFAPLVYWGSQTMGITGILLAISCADLVSGCLAAWFWKRLWQRLGQGKAAGWGYLLKDGYFLRRMVVWLKL